MIKLYSATMKPTRDVEDGTAVIVAEEEEKDNDGNSYMISTILVLATAPVAIAIQWLVAKHAPHNLAAQLAIKWLFTIYVVIISVASMVNLAMLFWRVNVGKIIEISPTCMPTVPVLSKISWRFWRLLDCYLSFTLSYSLVFLCFWVWDASNPLHDSQFDFCVFHRCGNIWSMWAQCIAMSFYLFAAAAGTLPHPGEAAALFAAFYTFIALPINLVVLLSVLEEARRFHVREEQRPKRSRKLKEIRFGLPNNDSALYDSLVDADAY
jgi:hypothetical protein